VNIIRAYHTQMPTGSGRARSIPYFRKTTGRAESKNRGGTAIVYSYSREQKNNNTTKIPLLKIMFKTCFCLKKIKHVLFCC